MEDKYIINDIRDHTHFKDKSFSGFKKTQVLNIVFKCIESKKLEQACHWGTECIISGYSNILLEKIILFTSKVIHINNPNIPEYILKKVSIFRNQLKILDPKNKDRFILLRNSQMIRNLFFDIVTTLSFSLRTKRYDKYTKIDTNEDFKYDNMKKRICGEMNILPDHIMRFNDPEEIKIIINEIFTMCKNKQFGYDRCCFWILWLIKWEAQHKKKNIPWNVDYREIEEVDKKYRCNVIWIIWDVIKEEIRLRGDGNITKQINILYTLFTQDYTLGKRNSRLPLVFHSIGFLTHEINFSLPIRNNFKIFVQVQCNVNKMFESKKKNENNNKKPIQRNLKKKEDIKIEIVQDKISIFNELDSLF